MPGIELTRAELRHLLRRLAFAATPDLESRTASLEAGAAFALLWGDSVAEASSPQPEFLEQPWRNTALAYVGLSAAERDATRAAQRDLQERQTEQLRQAWLAQMIRGPALRENLTLFFHSLYGSSSESVEIPHALHARNALYARGCMTSVPEILEALVLDPAMLIQIGMDGHGPDRVSDRPAKLILEQWTVGPGTYTDADVGELSRALTGWSLGSHDAALTAPVDANAARAARRVGIEPQFDAAQFEAGTKTILGVTREFDARSALRFLALQPATARRFGIALLRHLGVADPAGALARRLEAAYLASAGSIRDLLETIVAAPEFWSSDSRWTVIKSPVHLAVGACRQLELAEPPLATLSTWLTACGQSLFDTPNNGERGWPDQQAWITPADRLALRYRLPNVLAGAGLELGLAPRAGGTDTPHARLALPHVRSAGALAELLDAAPGPWRDELPRGRIDADEAWAVVKLVLGTPHYQLA